MTAAPPKDWIRAGDVEKKVVATQTVRRRHGAESRRAVFEDAS